MILTMDTRRRIADGLGSPAVVAVAEAAAFCLSNCAVSFRSIDLPSAIPGMHWRSNHLSSI